VKYTSEELSDFIYNRTFSIAGNNDGSGYASTAGTGWLFKWDGGYKYEMFTNWHVSLGMEKQVGSSYVSSNTNGSSISSFHLLTNDANWHEASYFKSNDVQEGVDAAVMTVDFSNQVSQDTNLLNRLDSLSSYASSHNDYLFNGIIDYNNLPTSSDYYVGGYPWVNAAQTSSYTSAQWWCSSDYVSSKTSYFASKSENHKIDDDGKIISIGNRYDSITNNTPMSKMGSGCSGSMIIDSNENLVGLLWGGGVDYGYPIHSYETFSWDNGSHNLYNDYINGQWISKEIANSHITFDFFSYNFFITCNFYFFRFYNSIFY